MPWIPATLCRLQWIPAAGFSAVVDTSSTICENNPMLTYKINYKLELIIIRIFTILMYN